jgi:hypothetical protein
MILSCARLVADRTGAPKPVIPGQFSVASSASEHDREIITRCNHIYAIASELCQPSESFDVRWETGWQTLECELAQLRCALVGVDAATDTRA